uniref:Uncharacterized protein n=1 Tax=viral metagenome TaxID=1070528 RepID=A0A6C0AN04_9ZZZZ
MESRVLNFTLDISTKCNLQEPLRMILWAGDCVNNGLTDIERLPNFDVYVCFGFTHALQPNIDFIYKREQPGVICIVDTTSDEQMQRFIKEFRGRVTTIDADYHGNTPTMKPEYYYALLAEGGEAYNVHGINSLQMYMGDYINTLEIFAPLLPREFNERRRFTADMIQLAKDNDLQVDMAWTSPDLEDNYYESIRENQKIFSKYRKSLNPNHNLVTQFNESTIEQYWSELEYDVLKCNIPMALKEHASLEGLISKYLPRFKDYISSRIERQVDDIEEYKSMNLTLEQIQQLMPSKHALKFTGFSSHISSYRDLRYNGGPLVYSQWFRKVTIPAT